jgi:hypothetical protein
MKVAIVHYHLQPGGVTQVIENTLQAWSEEDSSIDSVVLSGRAYPGKRISNSLLVPGLDYATLSAGVDPQTLVERLKLSAKAGLGGMPDIWHVHNHSLGKNPALTEAIAILAEDGEKLLLQPHDFAEDGRPGNFLSLKEIYPRTYPAGSNIHYAALNKRDQKFLIKMLDGTPSKVHLLANAVPSSPNFPSFKNVNKSNLPENLFLYPVRAVRRKNLGELALLATAYPDLHFANSLGPTNPEFSTIFENWKEFGNELKLPLTYGLGQKVNCSFSEIVSSATSILSVSIAEGFGLGFLEPWTFGKSLCGRNINEITSDFSELGVSLDHLYERLEVPLDCVLSKESLNIKISHYISKFYKKYNRKLPEDASRLAYQSIVREEMIDFGRLDESLQQSIIRTVANSSDLQSDLRSMSKIQIIDEQIIHANQKAVKEKFSSIAYAEKTATIYDQILNSSTPLGCEFADGQILLNQFLSPSRLNLLRTS